jgi:cytochrome oxidase Cu insertion factor (SCO1/SenC/PrrC family)
MDDSAQAPAPASEVAIWQTLPLVNARTGETFTLADFAGKTVYVEPMATWCINCRVQQGNVRLAREQVDLDQILFIGISVETNLTPETLAQYAEDRDYDWAFAVATPEFLTELVNTFGQAVTIPPSTPHFVIRPDGTTTELHTGVTSVEDLVANLNAASGV